MDLANIPKQDELSALYGSWNPMGYMRGMANQDLADQFRAQSFAGNAQELAKGQQSFDQNELMNPLLIQEKQGNIAGKNLENTSKGLSVEREQANQDNLLQKQIRDAAMSLTDDEIKQYDQRVTQLFQSGNPQDIALATKMQQFQQTFMAERRKAADALNQAGESARIHAGSAQKIEQMGIDAGKYKKIDRNSVSFSIRLSKMTPAQQQLELKQALTTGIDPDTGEQMTPMAQEGYETRYKEAVANQNAVNASRGQGQGATAGVSPTGDIKIVPKVQPSVAAPTKNLVFDPATGKFKEE